MRADCSREKLRRRCSVLTALSNHSPSEWAEITHPFHPLRGQRFPISKTMCVSGVDTLVLRTSVGGTFAIARDWTDHAEPLPLTAPAILDGECLLDLTTLLESLIKRLKRNLTNDDCGNSIRPVSRLVRHCRNKAFPHCEKDVDNSSVDSPDSKGCFAAHSSNATNPAENPDATVHRAPATVPSTTYRSVNREPDRRCTMFLSAITSRS